MPSEVRQKKIMEKLNRAQKCSILGPQNLGSGGARAPRAPPGSAPENLVQNTIVRILCNRSSLQTCTNLPNRYIKHGVGVISLAKRAHVCPVFWDVIGRLGTRACALKLDCTQGGGYFVQSVLSVSRLSARTQWILPCVCECVSCRYRDCRPAGRQLDRRVLQ